MKIDDKKFLVYLIKILKPYIKKIYYFKNDEIIKLKIKNLKNLLNIVYILKFHTFLRFNSLIDIVCIDNLKNIERFEIVYIFWSFIQKKKIFLIVNLNINDIVESLTKIHSSANWMERENYDLFGIYFANHNDLRRILTDYGFDGHPFKKDFPLNGYVEIRYDENKQYLIYEPIEFMQNFRYFNFYNPFFKKYLR